MNILIDSCQHEPLLVENTLPIGTLTPTVLHLVVIIIKH